MPAVGIAPGVWVGTPTTNPDQQPALFQIVGVVRDSTGAVVAGATVDVFDALTREWICSVTSDALGGYVAAAPGLQGRSFFVVSYKAGSPDTFGTTVNTLTPIAG